MWVIHFGVTMRKVIHVIIFALVLIESNALAFDLFGKSQKDFQYDADIVRAKHLKYYGELIAEYKRVTGSYPFMEDAQVPIYVFIATPKQLPKGYPEQRAPFKHKIGSVSYFFSVLAKELNREIPECYDPQYVSSNGRPNYYMYVANKGSYFFAVHFHNNMPFAKNVAKNYYKVDISNTPTEMNMAKDPFSLFKSSEFIEVINRPMKKQGFFEEREQLTISASKSGR